MVDGVVAEPTPVSVFATDIHVSETARVKTASRASQSGQVGAQDAVVPVELVAQRGFAVAVSV